MRRPTMLMASALVLLGMAAAHAQVSFSFSTGVANPYGSGLGCANPFAGRSTPFLYSNPGTFGLYSNAGAFPVTRNCAPTVSYGLHRGTHVGPYNDPFGNRNFGTHTGQHVDYVRSGRGVPVVVGTPVVGTRVIGRPVVGTQFYGQADYGLHCPPGSSNSGYHYPPVYYGYGGGYSGVSVTYSGFPFAGTIGYSNYSTRGTTQVYAPGATVAPSGYTNGVGTSASDYLPGFSYERVPPRAPERAESQSGTGAPAPSFVLPAPRPTPALPRKGRVQRGEVTVEFLEDGRFVDMTWGGNPNEVRAVTFMIQDSLRVPQLLRRVSSAPYRVRFDLAGSARYLSIEVEYREGSTTTHQIPLGES